MKKIYKNFIVDGEHEYIIWTDEKKMANDFRGWLRDIKNTNEIEVNDEEFEFLKKIGVI